MRPCIFETDSFKTINFYVIVGFINVIVKILTYFCCARTKRVNWINITNARGCRQTDCPYMLMVLYKKKIMW